MRSTSALYAAFFALLFSPTLKAAPVADFTFVQNCEDLTFTDQSTDSTGTIHIVDLNKLSRGLFILQAQTEQGQIKKKLLIVR